MVQVTLSPAQPDCNFFSCSQTGLGQRTGASNKMDLKQASSLVLHFALVLLQLSRDKQADLHNWPKQ